MFGPGFWCVGNVISDLDQPVVQLLERGTLHLQTLQLFSQTFVSSHLLIEANSGLQRTYNAHKSNICNNVPSDAI